MTSEHPSTAAFATPMLDSAGLVQYLARFGVETADWGTGDTKTVDQLLDEVRSGDSELTVHDGGLTRRVRNVWIDVYVNVGTRRHHLIERRQVLQDGRIRERNLPASLGEKCKANEDPRDAARRGIVEELSVLSPHRLSAGQPRQNPIGPPSYPTLRTIYDTYWFVAELDAADYRPEGYVEVQPDKSTYFEWESWES